jgi:hypothetical protein
MKVRLFIYALRFMKHHFYLKDPQGLSDCPSVKNNFGDEDAMKHLWNCTDRTKLKC